MEFGQYHLPANLPADAQVPYHVSYDQFPEGQLPLSLGNSPHRSGQQAEPVLDATQQPTTNGPTEPIEDSEPSSRPRLTREQVWLLERQFQAQAKPNSHTKRELAQVTGLSLARVANWFQNRRAKAKQQRKQEEFEVMRTIESAGRLGLVEPPSPDFFCPPDYFGMDQTPRANTMQGHTLAPSASTPEGPCPSVQYGSPVDASYASLSRSLAAAAAAVTNSTTQEDLFNATSDFSDLSGSSFGPPLSCQTFGLDTGPNPVSAFSDWSSTGTSSVAWTPAYQIDNPFEASDRTISTGSQGSENKLSDPFDPFINPLSACSDMEQGIQGQSMYQLGNDSTYMAFPDEALNRRGSASSDLIHTFSSFGLQGSAQNDISFKPSESALNIAARRKRPRPAALGGAALRSHSFVGAMPGSPARRGSFLGQQPPPLRRIKSTGQNLNFALGRIQKGQCSPAQKSSFQYHPSGGLVAPSMSQASLSAFPHPNHGSLAPPTPVSPLGTEHMPHEIYLNQQDQTAPHLPQNPRNVAYRSATGDCEGKLASPPTTPLETGCSGSLFGGALPERSPPYSAGPSPLSHALVDAPTISPHFTSFPSMIHMPQPMYVSPISCAGAEADASDLSFLDDSSPLTKYETHPQVAAKHGDKALPEFFFYEPTVSHPAPPANVQRKQTNYIFSNSGPENFSSRDG